VLRKEKFKFQKNLYSPFQHPKKITALKKKREFSKKQIWYFFFINFIFYLPLIFLQDKIQKNTPNEGRLSFVRKNMGGLGVPVLLHSTNLREPHIFKEKINR